MRCVVFMVVLLSSCLIACKDETPPEGPGSTSCREGDYLPGKECVGSWYCTVAVDGCDDTPAYYACVGGRVRSEPVGCNADVGTPDGR
jgi:hypothetical protein